MFYSTELSLSILSDNSDVHIVMSVCYRGKGVAKVYISVEIKMFIELMIVVVFR
jgi:hypothetical protein